MSSLKSIFLLGTGYIGGSLLLQLKEAFPSSQITVLIRKDEYIPTLDKLGVKHVKGQLGDKDTISQAVLENDCVIHAATADDEPSVEAVLEGIKLRAEKGLLTTYLHTSGTGELMDHSQEYKDTGVVFSDDNPAQIDALPDHADHRNVDLKILKARQELKGKAKISIILPPCIFGVGAGPFNKLSQQVIALETSATI